MKTIKIPKVMDLRKQARTFCIEIETLVKSCDESIIIDCSGTCVSRSAMDELYKRLVNQNSPAHEKVTLTNMDEDFTLKLKAVRKTQGLKKVLRKIPEEMIHTFNSPDALEQFVRTLR